MSKIQKILTVIIIFVANGLKLIVMANGQLTTGNIKSCGNCGSGSGQGTGFGSWLPGIKDGKLVMSLPVAMMGLANLALMLKLGSIKKQSIYARVLPATNSDQERKVVVYLKNNIIPSISNQSGVIEDDNLNNQNSNIVPNVPYNGADLYNNGKVGLSYNNGYGMDGIYKNGMDYSINSIEDTMPVQYPIKVQNPLNWPQTAESQTSAVWSDPEDNSKMSVTNRLQSLMNRQIKPVFNFFKPTPSKLILFNNNKLDNSVEPNVQKDSNNFNKLNLDNNYYLYYDRDFSDRSHKSSKSIELKTDSKLNEN